MRGQRPFALLCGLAALGLSAGALWASLDSPARPVRLKAAESGSLGITNSRGGAAILSAPGLGPGDSASGEVTITNTGEATGDLTLGPRELTDSRGLYGGTLSSRLQIRVEEAGSDGISAYAGNLAAMPELQLGRLDGGDSRSYRFAVSLPDGGPPGSPYVGDNVFQRAATGVSYLWTLTEAEDQPVPPSPPVPPRPPVSPRTQCISVIHGTPGRDRASGTSGGDLIYGGRGADSIRALAGDDCIYGEGGDDRLRGDDGEDSLDGGRGRDRLWGGDGNDYLFAGNEGRDVVRCGRGTDTAFVDAADRTSGCEGIARAPAPLK